MHLPKFELLVEKLGKLLNGFKMVASDLVLVIIGQPALQRATVS
jgi:hypothetical protein